MAHESFENEEAAALLNEHFVPVKVDREERPDIDTVYMNVCQAMTGSGGWPLTIFMTADKKPFYAGTYFPLHAKYGRIGLIELLSKTAVLWQQEREMLVSRGDEIAALFNRPIETGETSETSVVLENGFIALKDSFERRYGGFSYAPKFPMPHYLFFLLSDWKANKRDESLKMVKDTLTHMYRGGIYDHAGGGFARYSTDEKWLVPHFEKMLYDNALLINAYANAYAATGEALFRFVAEKTAVYMMHDMQTSKGGYASAEDADSEGVEGKFYVWSYDELKDMLAVDELSLLESRYGLKRGGNFEGQTILNRIGVADKADEADEAVLSKLYAQRKNRIAPFKDTKISAAWNGLAIEGMATAGMRLDRPEYIESAQRAADFILNYMMNEKGLICGTYMDSLGGPAFLADYANMAVAFATLYTASRKTDYIEKAKLLASQMLKLFRDKNGFAMTTADFEALFMLPRDDYDGAIPSGSASAVMALVKLYQITGEALWLDEADNAINVMLPLTYASPLSHMYLLTAMMLKNVPQRQIVISSPASCEDAAYAYETLLRRYDPFATVIWYDNSAEMNNALPHYEQYKTDAPFAGYVCQNFACQQPVYSVNELIDLVQAT